LKANLKNKHSSYETGELHPFYCVHFLLHRAVLELPLVRPGKKLLVQDILQARGALLLLNQQHQSSEWYINYRIK